MKMITKILTNWMRTAFKQCGYDENLGSVTVSDRWDLCQFQCNGAFTGAKLYKKPPIAIANEIISKLEDNKLIGKINAVPPGFINITLKDDYLVKLAGEISNDPHLGIPQVKTPETIVLDYGNPNVAKPLHIGHLRSAIIGESLKRLVKATGRHAIGDIHLGDWGLPMGLVIAELYERYSEIPNLTAELLNEIYPHASKKSKENPEFLQKARLITAQLQNGNKEYTKLWRKMVDVSVLDMKKTYKKLGVTFDYWYGESDSDKYIPELLKILTDKGLLYESNGAQVVDVVCDDDKAPMPPVIIKKSDNSSIYATTDLATIIERQRDFNPSGIWYIVDQRQSLHFNQVFRCARKAELVPSETELIHLGFGTMNGSDGKPYKTRDGGVMQLSELLDKVRQAAMERINTSEITDERLKLETVEKISIAAIKFGDLINHYSKDTVFDINRFLSPEGKTGVYLLYTVARINSILRKIDDSVYENAEINGIYSETERELILKIILCGETFMNAFNEKAPNIICENAYQLATIFSKFYHSSYILGEADNIKKDSWIGLCVLVKKMLLKHLEILGIEPVEIM